jgi:hypothetical protein
MPRFKIEEDVPIPVVAIAFPFLEMKIGDSFLASSEDQMQAHSCACYLRRKSAGGPLEKLQDQDQAGRQRTHPDLADFLTPEQLFAAWVKRPRSGFERVAQLLTLYCRWLLRRAELAILRLSQTKEEKMPIDEAAVEAEIQQKGLNAPRLSPDKIDAAITREAYHVFPGTTLTVCALTLRNGFIVTGESAAASPENFDQVLGQKIARDNARAKIWALEGYLLRERLSTG